MTDGITRRDFLNGVAISVVAGLSPLDLGHAAENPLPPPRRTGLRGSQPGSFEAAHNLAMSGEKPGLKGYISDPPYDLIVVGGGISGLSAAWFYREAFGPQSRILILDNHDDFGGHARRNEFVLPDGSVLIGYGGSEALESPMANFSDEVNYLMEAIGVRLDAFDTAFDKGFYKTLGLTDAVFFDREHFGEDRLCVGMPPLGGADQDPGMSAKAKTFAEFFASTPLPETAKAELVKLFAEPGDYLSGKDADDIVTYLQTTSYRDYLMRDAGLSEAAVQFFQKQTHDYFALGIESVSAYDAMLSGYAGFDGLSFDDDDEEDEPEEPYIYHFPDGNASIARLLVRSLIPSAVGGHTMEDIVTTDVQYDKLDLAPSLVRLRLNSIAVAVGRVEGGVRVSYLRGETQEQVSAKHCVLACYNMIIPHLLPELPDRQKAMLSANVKAPLVYVTVVLDNWQSFIKAGTHNIYSPQAFFPLVKLDYPVSLGTYKHPDDPAKPIALHMVHVPVRPEAGQSDVDQFRAGRKVLLGMTFEDFEVQVKDQLDRMLGPSGFDSKRDILAITVNRWPHGYAYFANTLFGGPNQPMEPDPLYHQPFGPISIANSDAGWNAFAHEAIDQAFRAVGDLVNQE